MVSLLVLWGGAPAVAQPYGSDLLVSHYNGKIYRVTLSGKVTTVGDYGPGNIWSITWDVDNRHLLAAVATSVASLTGHLLRINPVSGTATTVIPATGFPTTIRLDQNGDYLLACQTSVTMRGVMRVKRNTTSLTTIRSGFPSIPVFVRDRSSGDWLGGATPHVLQRYTPDFSRVIASAPHVFGYAYELVQDPHRLDVYVGAGEFCRFDPASNKVTTIMISLPNQVGAQGVAIDRAGPGWPGLCQ